jgi:hypothetical protein
VNAWTVAFLGVIAVASLAMAVAQIGVIVAAGRLARRVDRLADQVERELKPLFGHVNTIGRDASRAVSLAALQVERADRLCADVSSRIEQAMNALQANLMTPAREGRALLAALRAVIAAVREGRDRVRSGRGEDEDALFI